MVKKMAFDVYYDRATTNFTFEFNKPTWIDIRLLDADVYGDRNYKQFGVVSGAYIKNYYIFELASPSKEKVYLLIEENFWSNDVEDYSYTFEFAGVQITVSANLYESSYFSLLTEEELNSWYEWIDSI